MGRDETLRELQIEKGYLNTLVKNWEADKVGRDPAEILKAKEQQVQDFLEAIFRHIKTH